MNFNISNILLETSKYPDFESKQFKKLSKLIKFIFPECSITLNKKGLSKIKLYEFQVVILLNPEMLLTLDETQQFKDYLKDRGNLIVFSQPPNDSIINNLNSLLHEYHLTINNDKVIRTTYKSGYYHPKVAFISDGVINRSVSLFFKKDKSEFQVLYPNGHTINSKFPSIPILGTGTHCYPVNRPICGVYDNGSGKIILCGSWQILLDKYIDIADNAKFVEYLFQFLKPETPKLNELDIRDPGINEYQHVPNIKELASQLQYGIEETDSVDVDIQKLHFKDYFHISTQHVSTIKQVYNSLQIPTEPLNLVPPEFITPLPVLKLAIFHPTMRTIPPAPLELFDLDEHCASDKERLGILVNKCTYLLI